jgi:hypothetical protein
VTTTERARLKTLLAHVGGIDARNAASLGRQRAALNIGAALLQDAPCEPASAPAEQRPAATASEAVRASLRSLGET